MLALVVHEVGFIQNLTGNIGCSTAMVDNTYQSELLSSKVVYHLIELLQLLLSLACLSLVTGWAMMALGHAHCWAWTGDFTSPPFNF